MGSQNDPDYNKKIASIKRTYEKAFGNGKQEGSKRTKFTEMNKMDDIFSEPRLEDYDF